MAWYKIASVTTTGSAGSASGDSGIVGKTADNSQPIPSGFVMGAFIDFTTMPNTTDVTISLVMPNGALVSYLVTTNVNTDGYYPAVMLPSWSAAGVVSASDLRYPHTANGQFKTAVAQGDAVANGVAVWLDIVPD